MHRFDKLFVFKLVQFDVSSEQVEVRDLHLFLLDWLSQVFKTLGTIVRWHLTWNRSLCEFSSDGSSYPFVDFDFDFPWDGTSYPFPSRRSCRPPSHPLCRLLGSQSPFLAGQSPIRTGCAPFATQSTAHRPPIPVAIWNRPAHNARPAFATMLRARSDNVLGLHKWCPPPHG